MCTPRRNQATQSARHRSAALPGAIALDRWGHVVAGMHERKARMAELGDAFVALPGDAGTLEELFEVFTWGQLGLHTKPTALVDPDGFYAPLLSQLDTLTEAGYLAPAYRAALGVVRDATGLLEFLRDYQHPPSKWIRAVDAHPQNAQLTSVA
ncbi:MAG: LOG family protein [bacterium]